MKSEFWTMLVIALGYLFGVIVLGMTNGLHRFNPAWLIAGHTAVMMVVSIYATVWLSHLCVRLGRLLLALTDIIEITRSQESNDASRANGV